MYIVFPICCILNCATINVASPAIPTLYVSVFLCVCVYYSVFPGVLHCPSLLHVRFVRTHKLVCAHGAYVRTQTQEKMNLGTS
jgi:hypothetical protein